MEASDEGLFDWQYERKKQARDIEKAAEKVLP
jgi:hypothetical protein